MQKAKELWGYLSADEPENQARPVTLEQLIVLLTRESARRVVHFVNYTANVANNLPKWGLNSVFFFKTDLINNCDSRHLAHTTHEVVHQIICINNRIITITRLDKVKSISKEEAESLIKRMIAFYSNLQVLSNGYLVNTFDINLLLYSSTEPLYRNGSQAFCLDALKLKRWRVVRATQLADPQEDKRQIISLPLKII